MINCSLGDDGVHSYEDTCSFTCNTGYELTCSDTRTCQSNGNWSGSDALCSRGSLVSCSQTLFILRTMCRRRVFSTPLVLGPQEKKGSGCVRLEVARWIHFIIPFYITSNNCLIVFCSSLTDPYNGIINCSLGDDGVHSYEDTCSFTCNTGYKLIGSVTRTCQSDGSWSCGDAMCSRGILMNRFRYAIFI